MSLNLVESYCISKVNLQVECEARKLADKVIDAFDDYFLMRRGSTSDAPLITLIFKGNNSQPKIPETVREIFSSSSLTVSMDRDFCYLRRENSLFQIEFKNNLGNAFIDFAFWERDPKFKQEFFMLSLLWLLRNHELYALHGNVVVKDDAGIVFVGSSGSGKSTSALSLIMQGCSYLSDDITLLARNQNGIEAIAFTKGFSIDPRLAECYPELNECLKSSTFNGCKKFIDVSSIYPERSLGSCSPKVLIFPKIVSQDNSRLIPIDSVKSLLLLMENSGGILVDKEMAIKQIEVLKKLVYQASSYQLLLGTDVYEEPEHISEIISGIEDEFK